MFYEEKKWEADAGNISNYSRFDEFVYRNGSVNSFLNDEGKHFIIAAKGIGKTLLLSYKRYLMEQKFHDKGIMFIPTHHPYISFIESIKATLSKEHISKFESWEYCKKLWVLVIELSIISYVGIDVEQFLEEAPERTRKQSKIIKSILKTDHTVEYVFNEIIRLSESSITKFVKDVSNPISDIFSKINQGIIMFFDRLDNALETSHDSIWEPIQLGLLEAAWDVMRSNHHIKIYLSIRQEAYALHRTRNANAISSSVVKIEYSREELKMLLKHLVMFYEGKSSLEDFLGFETFPNTIVFEDEAIFDFMYRYSIGRPRDFVQFCDELSKIKDASFENLQKKRMLLKEKIRHTSSDMIVLSLYDELRMLLNCLTTSKRFDCFLQNLSTNILTYSEMQMICSEFNGSFCNKECATCSLDHHPFCDLYNMGLLGVLIDDSNEKIQHFKTPYENMVHGLRTDSTYFFIHPALREYINKLHMATAMGVHYNLFTGILIGEGIPWTKRYDDLCTVNKWIIQLKDAPTRDFFQDLLSKLIFSKNFRFPARRYEQLDKENYSICDQKISESLVNYFKTKKISIQPSLSIFVSYAGDKTKHKLRVESFVDMLREMGFNAQMDSSLKEKYPDIDEMMTIGLQMDKIIIVLSEEYKLKADGRIGGVWKEFKLIADDLEEHPKKYIFVSFDAYSPSMKSKISPKRIGNRWIVDLTKDRTKNYNELIAFIKEEKEYPFKEPNRSIASVKPNSIMPFE